ncbi:hypothetical protein [Helicobacter sp. MIT 14-3879]|uniref:hypothetical protein n=1 Tax=Helicobacter sp. MIT 14-3879 TaxID=2040649 RepID=UPI000E1F32F4|nr:hypothetical protein [Helicobacter sp. MIT 14-3879]RDU60884.1 hypothetical protein CQA44_10025 [Helicobacter sp. MIT 14-3879]
MNFALSGEESFKNSNTDVSLTPNKTTALVILKLCVARLKNLKLKTKEFYKLSHNRFYLHLQREILRLKPLVMTSVNLSLESKSSLRIQRCFAFAKQDKVDCHSEVSCKCLCHSELCFRVNNPQKILFVIPSLSPCHSKLCKAK